MKHWLLIALCCLWSCSPGTARSFAEDKQNIIQTNVKVREGFAAQDVDKILKYHHPDVQKVLAWNDYQKGHADMRRALTGLFENYVLTFKGSAEDMDSLEVFAQTAVMVAKFSISGKPKKADFEPFVFSGRTMIVYQRSEASPTGWVTFREMIIPAT